MELSIAPGEAAIVLFVLTFLGTLRPAWRLLRTRSKSPTFEDIRHEDKDGAATKESMAQFSNKRAFIVLFVFGLCGLGLSFADLVIAAVNAHGGNNVAVGIWLLPPAWLFLLVQLTDTIREAQPVARFESAMWKQVTTVMIGGIAFDALASEYAHSSSRGTAATLLVGLQLPTVLVLLGAFWSVKRRPTIFTPEGKEVDQEMTVSLWDRFTFRWAPGIMAAGSKEALEFDDFPAMNHAVRSNEATDDFSDIALSSSLPLWIRVAWHFRVQLIRQWIAILVSNFFDIGPSLAILQLLQYLETRELSDALDPTAWKYVLTIGAATVASTLVDSRIMWWEKGYIVDALRSTLTGLVYRKLLKKKLSADPPREEEKEKEEPDKDGPSKSEEDIINMFSVDCNQIAMFASESSRYVNIVGKMLVTVTFLWLLIGWQSLCAGLLGIAVLFPINQALARRYGKKQKALMAVRDKRTAMTTEALHGIRQIKFSAAEDQWTKKLEAVREEELAVLWSSRVDNIYMTIGSEFSPVVLTSLCLATYSYVYGSLLPSVAFTAISLFRQLEGIVAHIPYLMVAAITAKVSSDRIDKFLHSPEKGENTHPGEAVSFHSASVSFPCDNPDSLTDRFTLRNLNLVFPNHALSVISGPTGSGKSLLLAAILGEVEVLNGYVHVPREAFPRERFDSKATAGHWILPTAIAFVSQTPWIENATIKNNILFGLPFDPVRYGQVIDACALTADLALFEDGDETEVGVQGVSLSGGQKWRLSLARAIYSRAGILIMDDVFSALDAHVGKHVYENAVMGELAEGRTRILATHHVSLCLPGAKYAVSLSADGTLKHAGTVDELEADGELESIKEAEEREILIEEEGPITPAAPATLATKAPPKKLIEDEKRATGRVATSVYSGYLKATGGWPFCILLFVIFTLAESLNLGRTYWVRIWANSYGDTEGVSQYMVCPYRNTAQISLAGYSTQTLCSSSSKSLPIDITHRSVWFYLGMYCLISTVSVVVAVSRLFNISAGSVRASRSIFKATLHSVFRAPLRWFDTVPTGRILNRFTGDFTLLDSNLSEVFYYFSSAIWELIGIMAAAAFISPFMILVAPPLLVTCALIGRKYIGAARTVKRLESNSKSPVISHFAASLNGLSTIRAFSKSDEFAQRMYKLIDTYAACTWYSGLLGSWLSLWVGLVASLFPAAIAAFVIMTPGTDASLAGFALSFSVTFHFMTAWTIHIATRLELYMNATERIFEYRDLQGENPDGDNIRASWPETGRIEVNELEVGYADGLPSILKGLTFTAEPNQRIGVVGRTGAGKSTLSLALFRFLQTRSGSVVIDGVDISKIRLDDLRTRLAIIPQDPVLFSGTIRSNLDPLDQYSDHEIREALMRVHLIPSGGDTPLPKPNQVDSSGASSTIAGSEESGNANIFLSLSSPITAGGSNLSQGQKQLLCLARAILSRPKILILDEATSAVDMETDILIQRSIREAFTNTTLLVIAHRLSTVADFDRILVMKDGVAAEFGTPGELVEMEGGIFQDMVNKSGEEEEELKRMMLE
ncbi:P-loop containing nucleoside triphosphate hydrolase protein [Aspergillus ibericus CBS 121593]|uniref:P-loop containing nucleoside triphosphate hydrolase protein n=1 Tax=Aspergillus ibericus CBS 121593 TaxID=1448316 RepID=A0A395H429_9EURO|nr:P-loop containing nucleoside triphosphate hydrolase protein [Aspergillus ibericus CBS 121593]RAL02577.1 P-loop containing nucleoside triphosphate hydrolase protein [Aspergillus ibericus CBS 121593]